MGRPQKFDDEFHKEQRERMQRSRKKKKETEKK